MDLEIFWTRFAEGKLQDIFDYHKEKAGVKASRKIITAIVEQTLIYNITRDWVLQRNY